MTSHSTCYFDTFITVSPDSAATAGEPVTVKAAMRSKKR